jgi:hypothetical protein
VPDCALAVTGSTEIRLTTWKALGVFHWETTGEAKGVICSTGSSSSSSSSSSTAGVGSRWRQ